MLYMKNQPSEVGQYEPLVSAGASPGPTFVWWPDYLNTAEFQQYAGFIVPVVKRGAVISYTPNVEAYEDWVEKHPAEPETSDVYKQALDILLGGGAE